MDGKQTEMQIKAIMQDECIGFVYSNQLMVNKNNVSKTRYKESTLKGGYIFNEVLFRDFYCSTQTLLVKRRVFEMIGYFDETFKNALEDWELMLRMSYHFKGSVIKKPLFVRSENRNYNKAYTIIRNKNHFNILNKTFSQLQINNTIKRFIWRTAYFSWGTSYLQSGFYFYSIKNYWIAFIKGNIKAFPGLILSLTGPLGKQIIKLIS
jgi:GT2 family glycosyltransferase